MGHGALPRVGKIFCPFFLFFFFRSSPNQGDIYGAGTWVFYGVSCIVKPNTGGVLGKGKRKKVPMALGSSVLIRARRGSRRIRMAEKANSWENVFVRGMAVGQDGLVRPEAERNIPSSCRNNVGI